MSTARPLAVDASSAFSQVDFQKKVKSRKTTRMVLFSPGKVNTLELATKSSNRTAAQTRLMQDAKRVLFEKSTRLRLLQAPVGRSGYRMLSCTKTTTATTPTTTRVPTATTTLASTATTKAKTSAIHEDDHNKATKNTSPYRRRHHRRSSRNSDGDDDSDSNNNKA